MDINEKLKKHKFIIFGSDHYNTLGALRSIAEFGVVPDLILHPAYSLTPRLTKSSKFSQTSKFYLVDSVQEGYDVLIREYGNVTPKPFVISCDDWTAACMDTHYDEVISRFYYFGGGDKSGIISQYLDKANINQLAEKCGCTIPKSEIVSKGVMPKKLKYPVITKTISSMSGAWKNDVFVCHTPEELQKSYKTIVAKELLVEEFIDKEKELNIAGFSINNGNDVYLPFEMTSIRAPEGTYGHYMEIKLLQDEHLSGCIKRIIKESSYNGVFSVDLLIGKDGLKYFLEVNFRHSAFSYSCNYGGINLIKEWAIATLNKSIDEHTLNEQLTTRTYRAMAEPKDFGQSFLKHRVGLLQWLRDFHKAEVTFFYAKGDIKPALSEWTFVAIRKLKNILKIE